MASKDYYAILGVRRDASAKEIKQAYRRLARRYHPDVNPGDPTAEQKFKEISEAYAVLGNPESRRQYDRLGAQAFAGDTTSTRDPRGGFWGFRPGNLGDFFSGRGPFGEGLGHLLEELFRGGASRGQATASKGQDVEQTLDISFEEAVRGTTKEIHVARRGGSERLSVKIPPGVDTNSRVRLAGKGEAGKFGGPPGDLYIVIRVRPHPYFVRQGNDIHCEVPVTLAEALLGAKIEVPTLDGKITMTVPPGTQNGRVFRLRGKGVPYLKGDGRGDQYVTLRVVLPETLDERSRELIAEFERRNPLQPRAQMRW
ncbi:MAG: molecular chaperone DnaJ [Candidatus Tectimicrobiota bacterium]|nr:MAG: molecular chaperone DnaJ [Candidatus Tectomicrobia bacterium]